MEYVINRNCWYDIFKQLIHNDYKTALRLALTCSYLWEIGSDDGLWRRKLTHLLKHYHRQNHCHKNYLERITEVKECMLPCVIKPMTVAAVFYNHFAFVEHVKTQTTRHKIIMENKHFMVCVSSHAKYWPLSNPPNVQFLPHLFGNITNIPNSTVRHKTRWKGNPSAFDAPTKAVVYVMAKFPEGNFQVDTTTELLTYLFFCFVSDTETTSFFEYSLHCHCDKYEAEILEEDIQNQLYDPTSSQNS